MQLLAMIIFLHKYFSNEDLSHKSKNEHIMHINFIYKS